MSDQRIGEHIGRHAAWFSGFVVLLVGGAVGYGALQAKAQGNTDDIAELTAIVREQLKNQQVIRETLARIDERVGNIKDKVSGIQRSGARSYGGGPGGTLDSYGRPDAGREN